MKIYFCDICNESIPLQDIKEGVATTIDGKIYCQDHNPLKALERVNVKPGPRRLTNVLFTLVIVLLVAILAVLIWGDRSDQSEFATCADQDLLRGDLDAAQNRLAVLAPEIEALKETDQARGQASLDYQKYKAELEERLFGMNNQIKHLAETLQSASDVRKSVGELLLKQDEYNTRLLALEREIQSFNQRLNAYEKDLARLEASGVAVMPGGPGETLTPAGPTAAGESEELRRLKERLASKDNSVRFDAVNEIYDRRVKEALPYLVALLDDPDQFVQVAAIQTIGEFIYLQAIPELIKVLRDSDDTAREEALTHLVRMTGETNLKFDTRASKSEREKWIKKWEQWLANHNDEW